MYAIDLAHIISARTMCQRRWWRKKKNINKYETIGLNLIVDQHWISNKITHTNGVLVMYANIICSFTSIHFRFLNRTCTISTLFFTPFHFVSLSDNLIFQCFFFYFEALRFIVCYFNFKFETNGKTADAFFRIFCVSCFITDGIFDFDYWLLLIILFSFSLNQKRFN